MKDEENSRRNRDVLFAQLEHILSTSKQKFDMRKASNATRQKWARIIVQAIQVYGKLLDGAENEAILKKIAEIERKLGVKN